MSKETTLNSLAVSATIHCLTGCAIGEIAGLMIGIWFGLGTIPTIALAIGLAFIFGYSLSMLPLLKGGLPLKLALGAALAADTLSITTMEIVDNAIILIIPGTMDAGLASPLFWLSLSLALLAAFFAALPVNRYLIARGKGHALMHQ